jgi:hypothetical protein
LAAIILTWHLQRRNSALQAIKDYLQRTIPTSVAAVASVSMAAVTEVGLGQGRCKVDVAEVQGLGWVRDYGHLGLCRVGGA